MMKFVVLIISCVILLSSCREKQGAIPEIENLILDTRKFRESCIDSLFRIEKIVKLETRPDIVIGQISEVEFSKVHNRIIVLDSRHRKMVFLFDSSGHHVSSIQHSDIDDPFRPYVMRDIAVDEKNNDIFILDSHKKRIFNYDFNGNCKDSIIKLDYPAQSIKSNTNGDLLIQNKSSTFQLRPILYNLERQSGFKTISFKYFGSHQGDGMFHREISNFSYGNNGSIIYSNYLSDTIYRVTGGVQFIPYYYADFQEAKAPASFFSSLEDNSSWYSKLKQSDYGVKLGYFVENENCIMFPFYKGGNAYLFYKKLASGQPLICQYPNFGFNIPRAPIGFYDAGLILSLESSAVPKFISFVSKEGYVMTNFENELFHFFENS